MRIEACPCWVAKRPLSRHRSIRRPPVGAAEGCDLLILLLWRGSLPPRHNNARRYSEGRALNRRPITSSTSHPSRRGMAQSKAKSLRIIESHSTEPRMDRFFEHLRYSTNSIAGGVGQDIERRVGIDEQGGHVGAVAGERHEAVFLGWGIGFFRRVDRGEDFFHFFKPLVEVELPSAFLQAWVAAIRGVGISRPENSTTPKRARAQPPQLILRTHVDGRKFRCRRQSVLSSLEGFLHPATEFSVTAKDYRWSSFRTSSWKPLRVEGNFRRACPEISRPMRPPSRASLAPTDHRRPVGARLARD